MAKLGNQRGPLARPQQPQTQAKEVSVPPPQEPVQESKPEVSWWRRCPLCFTGYGGVGTATTTQNMKRYYKCNACGWQWHVKLDIVRSVQFVQLTVPTLETD
jgi:hypothetical protein